MGLGCLKMVINQNIKLNIDEKYFSSVLSDDEIKFLEDTEFVKELKTEINSIESCLDKIPNFTEIFPEAIGLSVVLNTSLSYFLSKMSFTIQPADLINTAPIKKSIK